MLSYYNTETQELTEIDPIQLVFPDEAQLKNEVEVLLSNLNGTMSSSDMVNRIEQYLKQNYGNCNQRKPGVLAATKLQPIA